MIWVLRLFAFCLCIYILGVTFCNAAGQDLKNKVTMSSVATAILVVVMLLIEYRVGC